MIVRPMEKNDLETVLALERQSFVEPWTAEHFVYELGQNPYSYTFICEQKGVFIGYINFWIMFDQATINKIAIMPIYQNRGIGKTLLNDAIERMKMAHVTHLNLEVRVSNLVAQKLYTHFGFTALLRKPAYYQDGEDAILMSRSL